MKSKIACSAGRIGLLDPTMIQGISDASAFHIGQQYVAESRVRIVQADEAQISAAVIGNSGLYEQTIRLKDNHLTSKCSCTLHEEPICRHCIAVLLEYHRWAQPKPPPKPASAPPPKEATTSSQSFSPVGKLGAMSSPASDVKLSEVMLFIEWLQPAMKALEKDELLPDSPKLGPGEVSSWIHMIKGLDARRRETEDALAQRELEMKDREAFVGRLTQQLQVAVAEVKAAQAKSQDFQRETALYQGLLAKAGELAADVIRHDEQVRSVANDILQKGAQLHKAADSFKETAEALKATTKSKSQPS